MVFNQTRSWLRIIKYIEAEPAKMYGTQILTANDTLQSRHAAAVERGNRNLSCGSVSPSVRIPAFIRIEREPNIDTNPDPSRPAHAPRSDQI